ncbi:MAG: thiamine pyrophosphate-binding protein [Gemmatimonadetes bacterium]|nr:thiamine pyrophosphate-binding protein [Gemmatimonadota bacterium]
MSGVELAGAMRILREWRDDRTIVVTTMGAAREWMALGPLHPLDFVLVPSSMGQASSLGLGLALARPDLRVVVVNGDGSLLMNLGSLVTIAAERPPNLVMVVVANGVYEVTGGQPTPGVAAGVDLAAVAAGSGWEHVIRCSTQEQWHQSLNETVGTNGPRFVLLESPVTAGGVGPRSPGKAGPRAAAFGEAVARVKVGAAP